MTNRPPRSPLAAHWPLDPDVVFLNHGSFGACPHAVIHAWRQWQDRSERQPMALFARDLRDLLLDAGQQLARFLHADPDGFAFVSNATEGVNAVLRSLDLQPGDELLTTDHAYAACRLALEETARRTGASLTIARIPFPIAGPDTATERILAATTPRTRFALIDHITSPTGLLLPIHDIVRELESRHIPVLVDGAHVPGMIPLDIDALSPSWYTGNFHKWLCAPKGSAFLWTRHDHRAHTRPLAFSHGTATPAGPARYHEEFGWTGTRDPSAWLATPACIDVLSALLPGGLTALQEHNHTLALRGRDRLCQALEQESPAPDAMLGCLAAVVLPASPVPRTSLLSPDPLQQVLLERWNIEVPVMPWPDANARLLRISAQAYNSEHEMAYLSDVLPQALAQESRPGA